MRTITYGDNPELNKEGWPPGEWDKEPDKVQFEDKDTGYPCLAVRNRMGAWCGYVGVPNGHFFYGCNYDDVELPETSALKESVDVFPPAHGGLTFSARCMEEAPEESGICHIPDEGESDDIWWLGFDCLHGGDLAPGMMALTELTGLETRQFVEWESYKPLGYVQDQCAELAAWLKAAA